MPLLPILLVAVVLAVDETGRGSGLTPLAASWGLTHAQVAWITLAPFALLMLASWLVMIICERRMRRGQFPGPLMFAERFARYCRAAIFTHHCVAVLVFGWVGAVRAVVGNPILLDELLAITPAVLALMGVWWTYYPIDQRLHQASLIRQLDEGWPVYPTLSRAGYVLLQTRLHLLLMLTPVLIIAALSETISRIDQSLGPSLGGAAWTLAVAKIAVGAGVFMLAPLLARFVLDVQPLSAGALRETLLAVCRRHAVKIRELLVWRTNGTVFNAAVMGLIGRLRYVLITDALLESMRDNQVRAVMAHEIGHVRRRHMLWMVVCLFACFALAAIALNLPLMLLPVSVPIRSAELAQTVELTFAGAQLALALVLFGWVCRRFERQADTFAVQHLSIDDSSKQPREDEHPDSGEPLGSRLRGNNGGDDQSSIVDRQSSIPSTTFASIPTNGANVPTHITSHAVYSMCDALDAIARLNAIDHHRPSWRHGSIAWRIDYLLTLIGQPANALAIDRTIARIKIAAAAIVVAAIAYSVFEFLQVGGAAA